MTSLIVSFSVLLITRFTHQTIVWNVSLFQLALPTSKKALWVSRPVVTCGATITKWWTLNSGPKSLASFSYIWCSFRPFSMLTKSTSIHLWSNFRIPFSRNLMRILCICSPMEFWTIGGYKALYYRICQERTAGNLGLDLESSSEKSWASNFMKK